MSRLPIGGLIDRSRPVGFTFDGHRYDGFDGDTLASALLANGVKLVGRSFKYHRPRGIFTAGPEEPNALVELRTGGRREPNTRATTVELYDGLVASSQNRWPSLAFDALAVNSLLSPFLGAGFYYKTFMWPARFWELVYEPLIRRAAGLGRAAEGNDPDPYERAYGFCDVLVIGSGPAGLSAALGAGRAGARVCLVEQDFCLGGSLLSSAGSILPSEIPSGVGYDARPAAEWAAGSIADLEALPNVTIMTRTAAFGVYDGGTYGLLERVSDHRAQPLPFQPRQRLWHIVAKRAVLATGAIERSIVFGGNDRPGVMLSGAAQTYARRYAVAPAERLAVFTNNDAGWRSAIDLAALGVTVPAVIDVRPKIDGKLEAAAEKAGIRTIVGGRVTATAGKVLRQITVATERGQEKLSVDGLAVSGGFSPTIHLACHHGAKPVWNEAIAAFVAGTPPPGMSIAGAAAGEFDLLNCMGDGWIAGTKIVRELGFDRWVGNVSGATMEPYAIQPYWSVPDSKGPAFVDLQNDVTSKDLELAHREGFRSVEHLKRYTTLGMATDQGKTANVPAIAMMAGLTGASIGETGTTGYRPPFTPVAIGAFAGHHRGKSFRPTRLPPTHEWARGRGAVFVESGPWLRAQYYPQGTESDWLTTVNREVTTVRTAVGFCDVSTLGKIDVQGPDAGALLDRVYINTWSNLGVGKARYGAMLREDGIVMDDGTTSRLAPDHYFMTTTTANAAKVYQHLEYCLQVLWPDLDVQVASVSDQWAQISIAGPRARDTLRRVVDSQHDISNAAFPYMGAAGISVMGGIPARLFRISFSGELAYEVSVPARHGAALAEALMAAGAGYGIAPYGTEALGVMRVEKGHVAGNELNGQTTARDLGLGRMMSTKKDYIGRVLAGRLGLTDPDRPSVVGFRAVDRAARLRAGAHFVGRGANATAENDEGYMTSVAFSPSLGHWIGLGLIRHGSERIGEIVRAVDPVRDGDIEVEIRPPCFIDPDGERLRV